MSTADQYTEGLARIIRRVAATLPEIGELVETEKWGQQAFHPSRPRIGTTIRIDKVNEREVAMYVHCQTTLVDTFRSYFPDLTFQGDRGIIFDVSCPLPEHEIEVCAREALLYHLNKRR